LRKARHRSFSLHSSPASVPANPAHQSAPHQNFLVWRPTTRPQARIARPLHRMPPYDSDSSDEGGEYTETNVLLGYSTKDSSSDPVSHLGGHAVSPSIACRDGRQLLM
jgi:hypothetical protein